MDRLLALLPRLLPLRAELLNDVGLALQARGLPSAAAAAFSRALQADPPSGIIANNLGLVSLERRRPEEAVRAFALAAERLPNSVIALANLCAAHFALGKLEEARTAALRAMEKQPDFAQAQVNLAHVLAAMGEPGEAMRLYRAVLERDPEQAEARFALATHLLSEGQWHAGWESFEARFARQDGAGSALDPPPGGAARWRGEPLAGKTLLLRAEQGLGDTIHFCRYAAALTARGARVALVVQRALLPLFEGFSGAERVGVPGDEAELGQFDFWSPLLSVLRWLDATALDVPVPYLRAAPERVAAWRRRWGADGGLRVGIAWAGNPAYEADRMRSLAIEQLAPLARLPCTYYSLHYDQTRAGARRAPAGLRLVASGRALKRFPELAAAIECLDLVVATDTVFAHLAGALGRPVWTLLAKGCDWRWGREGSDTPWYPTMRLYRQTKAGNWQEVLERVAADLERRAS